MTVHFDHNTAVIRSLQGKDQFYFGKHRSVIQNFHIRKVTLILLCVKSADISSDQTAFRINTLPYFGAFINRREECFQTGFAHFYSCFFIIEGCDAFSDSPFDLEEIIFQTVRQFVTFRIVRVHNITYPLCAHPGRSGKQRLGWSRLLFIGKCFFFHRLEFGQKAHQHSARMRRQLHFHLLFCFVIGYFNCRKT